MTKSIGYVAANHEQTDGFAAEAVKRHWTVAAPQDVLTDAEIDLLLAGDGSEVRAGRKEAGRRAARAGTIGERRHAVSSRGRCDRDRVFGRPLLESLSLASIDSGRRRCRGAWQLERIPTGLRWGWRWSLRTPRDKGTPNAEAATRLVCIQDGHRTGTGSRTADSRAWRLCLDLSKCWGSADRRGGRED